MSTIWARLVDHQFNTAATTWVSKPSRKVRGDGSHERRTTTERWRHGSVRTETRSAPVAVVRATNGQRTFVTSGVANYEWVYKRVHNDKTSGGRGTEWLKVGLVQEEEWVPLVVAVWCTTDEKAFVGGRTEKGVEERV
ncbi:hypothetical protein V6N12_006589 [Hibiscus sabdariffa]|uniref:Uncharacterized protein n=1 Tax=Hibiscus sabdariffa TaxID=183260 RepID=A0ABR2EZ79_9ROSI